MILYIVGGLFLAALALRKSSPKSTSETTGDSTPLPDKGDADGGIDVASAAGTVSAVIGAGAFDATAVAGTLGAAGTAAALTGGAVLVTAVGAVAGQGITGTTEGAVIGALNATQANAGNVGTVVGRELHKLLGGDGRFSGAGVAFQLAGFAGGIMVAVFGVLAGLAFIPIFLLVAGISSAVDDANRLAFGQAGAKRKFIDDAKSHQEIAYWAFKNLYPDTPEEDLVRYSWAYAIGYVNKINQLSWGQWAKRPWGTFVKSLDEHMKYGLDRGYWYSPTESTDLPLKATSPFSVSDFFKLAEPTPGGSIAFDAAEQLGGINANVFQYVWVMTTQPKSFMTSDYDHAVYWGSRGFFEGDIQSDGTLEYLVNRYDWRLKDKNYIARIGVTSTSSALSSQYAEPSVEEPDAATIGAAILAIEPSAPVPAPAPVTVSLFSTSTKRFGGF